MTEIDFPDTDADSSSIRTSYEISLSILATKKRDLEIRNDELIRTNASLNANYKVLKATISELSAEKKELLNHNKTLQKSLDYLREISGYEDLVRKQKQKADEKICAESWERNRIFDRRGPVQMEDGHGTVATTVNAQAEKSNRDEWKHDTSSLGLSCDCGTTFRVSGDNLSSIEVKHGTSTTTTSCQRKYQNKRAKNKADTPSEAEDHNPSSDPITATSLRSGGRQAPDMSEEMENLIRLVALVLVFVLLSFVARR